MLQLTTKNNYSLALNPDHISGVEQLPGDLDESAGELTARTRLHTANGAHDVIEPFEQVYSEWTADISGTDDADGDEQLANAAIAIQEMPLPDSVFNTPEMQTAFQEFKTAAVAKLATL